MFLFKKMNWWNKQLINNTDLNLIFILKIWSTFTFCPKVEGSVEVEVEVDPVNREKKSQWNKSISVTACLLALFSVCRCCACKLTVFQDVDSGNTLILMWFKKTNQAHFVLPQWVNNHPASNHRGVLVVLYVIHSTKTTSGEMMIYYFAQNHFILQ